ncbi:hypothetical protein BDV28DRAFT_3420 [Aspergillus coremiiformis]|uniref:Fungal-type protein kinase domain-containing protein n=1 Tax=Aspergillus coremiiformis TaxID=138285 RepID=A0A5N6Z4P5_9EURO|nr:hypothetical protein BDV28DRAFT_3420 [Aspergillus coremiiformis]
MVHPEKPDTHKAEPIGEKLDRFLESFKATCDDLGLPATLESISQFGSQDLRNVALDLLSALRALPDMRKRQSVNNRRNLLDDFLSLNAVIASDAFDIDHFIPLMRVVLNQGSDNLIWEKLYATLRETTPPPKPLPFLDTPYLHTTSSIVNSSEYRKHIDAVLKEELGSIFINVPNFHEVFFKGIDGFEAARTTVFERCQESDSALYCEGTGWLDWPASTQEKEVLAWITGKIDLFRSLMIEGNPHLSLRRTVLAQPSNPLQGSTANRKLDVAIVDESEIVAGHTSHWSRILIPGELKSSPELDTASSTWRDLSRYVREVFTAQDTRRFVLGFTLCGSLMRLWEFDRVGATASEFFDINKDGSKFVSVIVGYLLMDYNQLGYDSSIVYSSDGKRSINILRDRQPERIILDELTRRTSCIAGRATTCWKAHREGESNVPLVVKDSWQDPERDEEGMLLQEASDSGVINITRHFFHETVLVDGNEDDIFANIREGLDLARAKCHKPARFVTPLADEAIARKTRSISSIAGRKRSSSRAGTDTSLPICKRTCSRSSSENSGRADTQNRVHRRVIVQDYGKPLYRASSLAAMLNALLGCLEGYHDLYIKTGLLQGDISTGNLMMNEDNSHSRTAFLIDLDLAIREKRDQPSGARGKTGTRAFMPIGQLLGEPLSWVLGLESFFWVLFWMCIHYDGPDKKSRVIREFDEWNYASMERLAKWKLGTVSDNHIFESTMDNFTDYYSPLKPWVDELRKAIFPDGRLRRKEDEKLFDRMCEILRNARDTLRMAQ